MTTQLLNLETATRSEIIIAASLEKKLMDCLGGIDGIKERTDESLRSITKMWFKLNTEVGAFYGKNGF